MFRWSSICLLYGAGERLTCWILFVNQFSLLLNSKHTPKSKNTLENLSCSYVLVMSVCGLTCFDPLRVAAGARDDARMPLS